jgi:hypothetical protein
VLDAECAGWSDPAFDLAFCLNHLLLKSVWIPSAAQGLRQGFKSFSSTYLSGVDWEAPTGLEARAARLLAALLLARIDGKSPVEYIGCAVNQEMVRGFARRLLLTPEANLDAFAAHWFRHLSEHVSRTPSCNA